MNLELTSIHQEVIANLESVHGALLRMNRSIQAEGTLGILKWDKSYKRLFRRDDYHFTPGRGAFLKLGALISRILNG